MVGPCEWEPPADVPMWLNEIKVPIVLVTTSSEFQDDGRLVQAALEGLAGEPVAVVVTVPAGDPSAFDPPPNPHVDRFVPNQAALDRPVSAVTHGGMAATHQALSPSHP